MYTLSLNRILRRWLISLSGIVLGVLAAAVFLLWVGNSPQSAQAADSPFPGGDYGPRSEAEREEVGVRAAVKDPLVQEGSIGPASLVTSPTLILTGEAISNSFGGSVATAGDVNGDGYSDVIVGATRYYSDTGRVYVYLGSANGLSPTPTFTATGESFGSYFGSSVRTAGDVNGDGYADVIIGARGDLSNTGRAYVYLGSPTGLGATPAFTATGEAMNNYFGRSVATAGDVNGDNYSDVVIGAPLYSAPGLSFGRAYVYAGSVNGLSATPIYTATAQPFQLSIFGTSVGPAGDVNGDGYADIIIGAELDGGGAYVYLGSSNGMSTTPIFTATGGTNSNFGLSLGIAGDVNGDGYTDVIIGASGPITDTGHAYLYLGSAAGPSITSVITLTGQAAGDGFGVTVATAGDVNGDGYADVIAVDGYISATGRANVFLGSATGLITTPAFTVTGEATNDSFGYSAATAGDVNGDGYADIIVGAPGYSSNTGRAYVYHGAADAPGSTPVFTATGEASGNLFAFSAATAGDVNGDRYADLIVGASGYISSTGRVYVYLGSASGLSATPAFTATGQSTFDQFGISVDTAGDVNGDGYDDIIVGAYGYGGTGIGHVYVYHGSAGGLSAIPAITFTGQASGDYLGISVGTAGDVNGDGYADVIVGAEGNNRGRANVYLGSATGLSATPAFTVTGETSNSYLGWAVGSAGDVNGDGYSDVIVGAAGYNNYTGRTYLYLGSANGLNTTPVFTATGEADNASFGRQLGSAGDVNGDGYADIIIGARNYNNYQGRAYLFHGSASGVNPTPAFTATGEMQNNTTGWTVGTAGDLDGDGYSDVIIGEPGFNNGIGRVFIHSGSASGLKRTPVVTLTSETILETFGVAVGTAGDVNGDGYADIVIGAPGYDYDFTGRAYVYPGNGNYGLSLTPQQRRADNTAPIAHGGQSDSATSFRLAALGRSPFGRGKVKLEWEVKPLGTPFDGTGTQQSAAWLDSGTAGAAFNELVTGLSANTLYHWRVRVRYHPATTPFQQYSRWFTQPWNGWQEADLRTAAEPTPPPIKLYLPFIAR